MQRWLRPLRDLEWLADYRARLARVARRRRYLRALRDLEHLDPLELPVLLDRLRHRLPLPPEALSRSSEERFNLEGGKTPADFLVLAEAYRSLLTHPAWQDFQGRLLLIRDALQQGILQGAVGQRGEDMTPYMRAAYYLLLDILTTHEKIEQRRAWIEREILGVVPTPPDQPVSTTTWEIA